MKLTHEILLAASQGGVVLCKEVLAGLRQELPQGSFTATEVIAALPAAGGVWYDAARLLRALERAGFIPVSDWPWLVARVAFRVLPAPLNRYGDELSAKNWQRAKEEAQSVARADPNWPPASSAAVNAGNAAAAANAADDSSAYTSTTAAAYAAYTTVAAAADAGGEALSDGVRAEIVAIICEVVDSAPAVQL